MDVDRELQVRRLGVVPYGDALDLQKRLVEERRAGQIPDQLLLLQHPPVITLGVKAGSDRSHVLASSAVLEAEGVDLFETGRGGDVTYHGPGQLAGIAATAARTGPAFIATKQVIVLREPSTSASTIREAAAPSAYGPGGHRRGIRAFSPAIT
jgi:hypothetical protein